MRHLDIFFVPLLYFSSNNIKKIVKHFFNKQPDMNSKHTESLNNNMSRNFIGPPINPHLASIALVIAYKSTQNTQIL